MFGLKTYRIPARTVALFDPAEARAELGRSFMQGVMADFERHGLRRLKRLRRQRPQLYFRLVADLLPKEYRLKKVDFSAIPDDELQRMLAAVREAIKEKQKQEQRDGNGAVAGEASGPQSDQR